MVIDTHAHLDFRHYDSDRPQVIERAFQNGLSAIINVGVDLESSKACLRLSEEHQDLYTVVGFHPHHAEQVNSSTLTQLTALARLEKVVAIGEIGLDYYRNYAPHSTQKDAFRRQIRLARKLKLPIVVHIRQAYEDAMTIIEEEGASETGGVLHCFSGDDAEARWAIDRGFHLSFPGVVTFPRSRALDIAASVPPDRLLLETDCPFLAPHPYRGKRNEPSYVKLVAQSIARARGTTFEKLAQETTDNAKKVFRLSNTKY
ncbi:MAG: TatD family hydrolase [Gemmatimonadota bacterium]|nr:MAG: TatD family hydrolase [Gemmatimonadota bacterium]